MCDTCIHANDDENFVHANDDVTIPEIATIFPTHNDSDAKGKFLFLSDINSK